MPTITPFLWFDTDAEEAANFYLSIFPAAKKLNELRSKGVGPWPESAVATITIELLGQQMTFLNGGTAQKLTPASPSASPAKTSRRSITTGPN